MLLVRPKSAGSRVINISESWPALWDVGATYGDGAHVSIAAGTARNVFKSLATGNLGNDPTTSAGWWVQDGVTYDDWDVAAAYAAGDRVIDLAAHRVLESLGAGNLAKPLSDPAWWVDIGPTNAQAMFDSVVGTVTSHPYQIDVTQEFSGRVDSVALLGLANAVSARIIMSTTVEGVVFDESYSLISTAGISDWFAFFFEDIARKSTLLVSALPAYVDPTIRVIIEGNGSSPVEVGLLSIGLAKNLGETGQDGAQVGIIDYSRKSVDEFGNYTIVPRSFSKRGNFRCLIPNSAVDGVQETLSAFRATPAVYSASEDYGATLIFGFFRDFSIEIAYPTHSLVSIEIEGLT